MQASEIEDLQKEIQAMTERLMPEKHYYIGVSLEERGDFKVATVTNLKTDSPYYIVRGLVKGFIEMAGQLQNWHLGRG